MEQRWQKACTVTKPRMQLKLRPSSEPPPKHVLKIQQKNRLKAKFLKFTKPLSLEAIQTEVKLWAIQSQRNRRTTLAIHMDHSNSRRKIFPLRPDTGRQYCGTAKRIFLNSHGIHKFLPPKMKASG
jgi:hypothetical protein